MSPREALLEALKLLDRAERAMRPPDGRSPPPLVFLRPWSNTRMALTTLLLHTPIPEGSPLIHYSDEGASGEGIRIMCTETWMDPKWDPNWDEEEDKGFYTTTEGSMYTFDEGLVTCEQCRNRVKKART